MDFFKEMAILNRAAFINFILGKLSGFVGVALGFVDGYHRLGGYLLILAFVFILLSVVCSILQGRRDRVKFSIEDSHYNKLKDLAAKKLELELEIKLLEERRLDLHKFKSSRQFMNNRL
jgi:hypothetical protein